ncbi:MAG: NUDIX domain-containing protein, partial [Calditrichia bacterium]
PRQGEDMETATIRRLEEELGIRTHLKYLFKFQYQARFNEKGSENELCSVYVGVAAGPVRVNPNEISDWKFFSVEELETRMDRHPEQFTPWFKMEWRRMREEYWEKIEKLWK